MGYVSAGRMPTVSSDRAESSSSEVRIAPSRSPCAVHVAGELVCGRPPLLRPRGYARTRERIPFPLAQCTTRVTLNATHRPPNTCARTRSADRSSDRAANPFPLARGTIAGDSQTPHTGPLTRARVRVVRADRSSKRAAIPFPLARGTIAGDSPTSQLAAKKTYKNA